MSPSLTQPYGKCPVCALPLIYSPTRQLLICSDPLCKHCQPFTPTDAENTNNILAEKFLSASRFEEQYAQRLKNS